MAYDLATAIANHMNFFHGKEEVTYQRRTPLGATETSYTQVVALKRATQRATSGAGDDVQITTEFARWHIKANSLAVVPRKYDRIVSTTFGTWEVDDVSVDTLATRYACECKKIAE